MFFHELFHMLDSFLHDRLHLLLTIDSYAVSFTRGLASAPNHTGAPHHPFTQHRARAPDHPRTPDNAGAGNRIRAPNNTCPPNHSGAPDYTASGNERYRAAGCVVSNGRRESGAIGSVVIR